MYIHELYDWPQFIWDREKVSDKLLQVTESFGYMHGRLSMIGFDERLKASTDTITSDIVSTSHIEGIRIIKSAP